MFDFIASSFTRFRRKPTFMPKFNSNLWRNNTYRFKERSRILMSEEGKERNIVISSLFYRGVGWGGWIKSTERWGCQSISGRAHSSILSLPFILSGPYSAKTALQFLRLPHSYANIPSEHSNCSVFRSSQWRVHRFTSHNSSSRRNSKSSLTPFHLKY